MTDGQDIRVVVVEEGDMWVAQCLEYDIGAQADELDDLYDRLQIAFMAELKASVAAHGVPFQGIEPAPEHFRRMWESCASKLEPVRPFEVADTTVELALCA